jgi:hypothetical protein
LIPDPAIDFAVSGVGVSTSVEAIGCGVAEAPGGAAEVGDGGAAGADAAV